MTCRVPLHMLRGAVGPQSARGKILTDTMRLFLALLIPALLLHGQSSTQTSLKDPPSGTDSVVLISLGLTDTISTVWDGSVQIQDGMLLALIGREFRVGDVIHSPNRWQASSRPGFVIAKRLMYEQYFSTPEELQILEPSFYAFLDSGPATQLTVDTEQGMFDIRVSDLAVGETKTYLGGRASAQRTVFPRLLGRATRGPDFVRRTDHRLSSGAMARSGPAGRRTRTKATKSISSAVTAAAKSSGVPGMSSVQTWRSTATGGFGLCGASVSTTTGTSSGERLTEKAGRHRND